MNGATIVQKLSNCCNVLRDEAGQQMNRTPALPPAG